MVKLILVKNVFAPQDGREIRQIEPGCTVAELLEQNAIEGVELEATVNGESVDSTTTVNDNDFVVIHPVVGKGDKGGKGILGIVAAIALTVVSFGIASGGWLAGLGKAFAAGAWGAYAAATAVMFLGSMLMGRMSGQKTDTGAYEEKDEPTYSWGEVRTMEGQNNPIALTYGKVKSGGQTIGKYVNIDDNEEYLNWLVAAGEGPLTFSEIKLNDNDYDNYDDVEITTRAGENDQDIISEFGDTYSSKSISYKLGTSWSTDAAPGSDTRGLIFTIEFPNGLYHVTDSGKLESAWVTLDIEYKKSGGSWTNLFKEITAVSSSYFSSVTSTGITLKKNVGAGTYSFTLSPKYRYNASDNASDDYYFDGVTVKIGNDTGDLSYKNFRDKKAITVGSFQVTTSKWPEAVRNRLQDGNSVTGTITVSAGSGVGLITGSTRSALRKQFRINKISAGEYEARVKVKSRQYSETSMSAASTCYWTTLTSVIYDDFIYPCTALIGIKAKATDQLSGSPMLTFLKARAKVWVWNPNANEYQQKNANNPAWACYDMLHQARQLKNVNTNTMVMEVRGVPASRMRYADFAAWASWCNSKKLYVNIEINSSGDVLDVINQRIAPIGRGMVVRFGTRYGCIYEHAQEPVQMFGMGNIITGTFTEEFLNVSDRANCVEVTYTNAAADYERDVITIYGDTFNTDGYAKTAQLTMDGITNYEQAFREGKYQLACNKYQLRTVSFEADIDSIACTVGDVVLVAHDVPKWAYSGRIQEVSGNRITLPCYVTDTSLSYRIQYRKVNDNIYTKACTIVSSTADGWTVIQVSDTTNMPQAQDVFDLAVANIGSKPFVIKSITRSQEFRRRITCVEYAEALYDENYDIPVIDYSMTENKKPKNVTRLSATQYAYTDSAKIKRQMMSVSWQRPSNGGKFTVLISTDKKKWTTAVTQTEQCNVDFETTPGNAYYVKVITTLGLRQSSGTTTSLIPKGLDPIPPDVKKFEVELMASGMRRFWWKYTYPTPNDIAGFRIKYIKSARPNWSKGTPVHEGLITSQPFLTQMIKQGTHTVMIKAVDNAGQESKNFAYCVINLGDLLEDNILWTKDFKDNDWEDVAHNGIVTPTGNITSKDNSNMWTTDNFRWYAQDENMWEPAFDELTAEIVFTAPAYGQFWIKTDIEGPGIVYYCRSHFGNRWTYSGNAQWVEEAPMWELYWDMDKQWSDRIIVNPGDIIKIKIVGTNEDNKKTQIKDVVAIIDVPDIFENFENLPIAATGTQLPVKTPYYYTVAVRLNAVQNSTATTVRYLSRTPCVIQLLNNNGTAVSGVADITWQGYRKEIL